MEGCYSGCISQMNRQSLQNVNRLRPYSSHVEEGASAAQTPSSPHSWQMSPTALTRSDHRMQDALEVSLDGLGAED